MRGVMIMVGIGEKITQKILDHYPTLEEIKDGIGGGYIELVPYFDHVHISGKVFKCQVFCDEDGKGKGLTPNIMATMMWAETLQRNMRDMNDFLVGPIVILIGDTEFFKASVDDGDD